MKILACIKQILEIDSPIRIAEDRSWVQIDTASRFRINRYDAIALEQALLLKDAYSALQVDVVSVGPARCETALKRAIGMGADHGIHILTRDDRYLSPFTIAERIASYARNKNYDLLLAGVISEDGMHGQVGPLVAELLDIPCAMAVITVRIDRPAGIATVESELTGGVVALLELNLPALLMIQNCSSTPRYPSLSNILRAKRQDLEVTAADSSGISDAPETVGRLKYPQKSRAGIVLQGSTPQKASELLKILNEKSLMA